MQQAGTYIKLLHTVTTKIKALKSQCQLLYTYDEKRHHDYPVGLVVMNVCTVRTQSQLLPGYNQCG